jgi:hypothetical protein
MTSLTVTQNTLIKGDVLDPSCDDIIAQIAILKVGEKVPKGWNVLTGNSMDSLIGRVVLRMQLETM